VNHKRQLNEQDISPLLRSNPPF